MEVEMDFCCQLPFILDLILILILQTYLLNLLLVSLKFDSSSPVGHSPPRCTLHHILNFLNYYHYCHVLKRNISW